MPFTATPKVRLFMPRDNDKDNDSRGRRGPAQGARSARAVPAQARGAGEEIRQARL